MCDTFAATGQGTSNGSVIFGKNSDRRMNEPHILLYQPRREYKLTDEVQATYIKLPQARATHEVLLCKPSWIWGAEMGCNEYGLCIGNEAVFSKEPIVDRSLIGMDYVRLALERCENALAALQYITDYLQRYNQGGNCVFKENASYQNAFILADPKEAYVLETAGVYWAAVKVKDCYAISNCLSIGRQFDLYHPRLVDHAREMGWCSSEDDFDFAQCYGDSQMMETTGGVERRRLTEKTLNRFRGQITVSTARELLRQHNPLCHDNPFDNPGNNSVCMHGGGEYKNQTTGSFIAELGEKNRFWATGCSLPCISAFKPVCLGVGSAAFREEERNQALAFWKNRETIRRAAAQGRVDYRQLRDESLMLEARFDVLQGTDAETSRTAFCQEEQAVQRRLKTIGDLKIDGLEGDGY